MPGDAPRPHRVVALCLDWLVAFDLGVPAQVFAAASAPDGTPLYEFSTCSAGARPVRTGSGFGVTPAADLAALAEADTVVVPGYGRCSSRRRLRRSRRSEARPSAGPASSPSAPGPSRSPTPASSTVVARPPTGAGRTSWQSASRR